MNLTVRLLVPIIVLVVLGVLFFSSTKRKPEWFNNLDINWQKMNIYSFIGGFSYALFNYALFLSMGSVLAFCTVVMVSGILGYIFIQSLITDVKLRLVDRKLLFLATILSAIFNYFTMFYYHNNYLIFLTTVYALIASIFILLPRLIGASDGRALLLCVVAAFPLLTIQLFGYAIVGMFLLFIVYSLFNSIRLYRSGKLKFYDIFVNRVSIPAVPIIVFPMMVMISVGSLL